MPILGDEHPLRCKWLSPFLLACAVVMLTFGCQSAPEQGVAASGEPAESVAFNERTSDGRMRFVSGNGEARQRLDVWERANGTLDVAIIIESPCLRSEDGLAQPVSVEGDMDIEVDPVGGGHPTDTFFLEPSPGCTIAVRLALGDRRYAWLRESGCVAACPFSEEPMVRR